MNRDFSNWSNNSNKKIISNSMIYIYTLKHFFLRDFIFKKTLLEILQYLKQE